MELTSEWIWLYSIIKRFFGACAAMTLTLSPSYQAFRVPSAAMQPTILIGDHILVNKVTREIKRGDIVAFEAPAASLVSLEKNAKIKVWMKRVVGLPGEKIEVRQKQLLINGKPLHEPYCLHIDPVTYPAAVGKIRSYQFAWESGAFAEFQQNQIRDNFGPIIVPIDSYFVLGDNREGSFDSRYWGPLRKNLVVGYAVEIYAPISRARTL